MLIENQKIIENVLSDFSEIIGKDLKAYRNHLYRILNYAISLDGHSKNIQQYAIAAAFHDIGIWTHNTFDYLAPSIQLAENYLMETGRGSLLTEVSSMINMHHKMSPYTGEYSDTVEIFRQADWIDVSMGVMKFGIDRNQLKSIRRTFPYYGFHFFLARQTFKNFLKHPLNPLPMFKK